MREEEAAMVEVQNNKRKVEGGDGEVDGKRQKSEDGSAAGGSAGAEGTE